MKCDAYQTNRSNTAVLVSAGANVTKFVPPQIHSALGPLKYWKTVTTDPKMIGADPRTIEQDINSQGYSIQSWKISFGEE